MFAEHQTYSVSKNKNATKIPRQLYNDSQTKLNFTTGQTHEKK